jgi:hypothetical protein
MFGLASFSVWKLPAGTLSMKIPKKCDVRHIFEQQVSQNSRFTPVTWRKGK